MDLKNRLLVAVMTIGLLTTCRPGVWTDIRVSVNADWNEAQAASAVAVTVLCMVDGKPDLARGSGVIIGRTDVLSASHVTHCASGEGSVVIETLGGEKFRASVVEDLPSYDISHLRTAVPLPPVPPARFGPAPKRGDVICHESAMPARSRVCGIVSRVTNHKPNANIEHGAHTVAGNSGSGAFDAQGRLIGIATMYYSPEGIPSGGSLSCHFDSWMP